MLLAPAIYKPHIMKVLDVFPQKCFHIDSFIFPYLLKLIDGHHNPTWIIFKVVQQFRKSILFLTFRSKCD